MELIWMSLVGGGSFLVAGLVALWMGRNDVRRRPADKPRKQPKLVRVGTTAEGHQLYEEVA